MIEDTLRELHHAVEALNDPAALRILNIDEGALDLPETTREYTERYRAWTQLLHISKSIPDLLNQSASPPLVGFLGHFSSGKSSLISALLDTPEYKRRVGQHPTDTSITLITHPDHDHLLEKAAYTVIDAIEVVRGPELQFLKHATLVDTPGLGNDAQEYEAVTRFLHLCHVLVLTIDGRCPFADKEKDFALLNTAFNKLRGVPKVLVVTCADQFLTSRTASFETDWHGEWADAFWEETIQRLTDDPQFQDHARRLASARPYFVDSIEGFRVDQVREALLPIARDDAQRARTQKAQSRYVLATAHEALCVLLNYISERSENLNRLHSEAARRAEGTETAVAELLQVLVSSFQSIRERLGAARQSIPSIGFDVETTVTPQAIKERHEEALGALLREIREALRERLADVRKPTYQEVHRLFRRRSRAWFLTPKSGKLPTPSELQTDMDCELQQLETLAEACAQTMLGLVNQSLRSTTASSVGHLQGWSEAREVGTATSDIKLFLERFQEKHDDSIKAFHAYIAAPSSSDLLLEHGFALFDESGEQAISPEPIRALDSAGFETILEASEASKAGLRDLAQQGIDDPVVSSEDAGLWLTLEDLGDDYSDELARHISSVCQTTFDEFVAESVRLLDDFGSRNDADRERVAEMRRRVWEARGTLARRIAWIATAGTAVLVVLFTSDYTERVISLISDDDVLLEIVKAVVPTGILGALVYVASGAKNETIRTASRFVLAGRLNLYRQWRQLDTLLSADFEKSYDQMIDGVDGIPFHLDAALATTIVGQLKSRAAGAFSDAHQRLTEVRSILEERGRLFDQYCSVVNRRLEDIPVALRDRADGIKSDTIEKHLERIRNAARSVDAVKADVQGISSVAELYSRIEI